jgi:integrase
MAEKLTDSLATDDEKIPSSGNRIIYDTDVKGFGLRITVKGARAWVLNYRTTAGVERRLTIGSLPDWNVRAAREEAKRLKRLVDQGQDPMGDRHELRTAPTVADLIEQWRTISAPKRRDRTRAEYEGLIRQWVIPELGNRKVADVMHADIVRLHGKISKRAPVRANRTVAFLSTLFNLAVSKALEWRADNPAAKIEHNHESPRQRYLRGDELRRLTEALAAHKNQQTANVIRLLLLTGARRSEALSATWEQIDLEAGTWTKPAAYTKQKREHVVQLSAPAQMLLSGIRRAAPAEHFVFPSHKSHLTELKASWAAICRAADLRGVRLHDLRHSFASIAASSGASLPLIGGLLGHTQPSTTARYAHLFDEAQRAVAERVGAVITGTGSAEVVPLKKGA